MARVCRPAGRPEGGTPEGGRPEGGGALEARLLALAISLERDFSRSRASSRTDMRSARRRVESDSGS